MPIYEYQCKHCHHQLELIQKMSEPPALNCPSCQLDGLEKKISASGFKLQGTGWYATDFKDQGKRQAPKKAVDNIEQETSSKTAADSKKATSEQSPATND